MGSTTQGCGGCCGKIDSVTTHVCIALSSQHELTRDPMTQGVSIHGTNKLKTIFVGLEVPILQADLVS